MIDRPRTMRMNKLFCSLLTSQVAEAVETDEALSSVLFPASYCQYIYMSPKLPGRGCGL